MTVPPIRTFSLVKGVRRPVHSDSIALRSTVGDMQTDIAPPFRAPIDPAVAAGQHAALVPPTQARRLPIAAALLVVVLVVGLVATAVAVALPFAATRRVDTALVLLRSWPSAAVDGVVVDGTDRVEVHATVTAEGAAGGTLQRTGDARAEIAVGGGATLLRGNTQWWSDRNPSAADLLAGRWVRSPRGGPVDLIADGRLTPRALADALATLREPTGRTETQVVVDGVRGTAFTRGGARLVVSGEGRPLAVGLPATSGVPAWSAPGVSLDVAEPDGAGAEGARRAVSDVLAQLHARSPASVPSPDEVGRHRPAPPVAVAVTPVPGCLPTACSLDVSLTNTSAEPTTGQFVLRVDGRTVTSERVTVPARTRATLTIALPASVLARADRSRITTEASFESAQAAAEDPTTTDGEPLAVGRSSTPPFRGSAGSGGDDDGKAGSAT